MGRGETKSRAVTYCIVPRELAPKLHELLREHFRDDASIEVVVELREAERRGSDRRAAPGDHAGAERRRVPGDEGRRIAERRLPLTEVEPLELPRRARSHREALRFVQREMPSAQTARDAENARLVRRFQTGDKDAFAELYMTNFSAVYSYVRIALRDHHEAEDVTQLVFMNVMRALPRYRQRGQTPFRAWLFRIVRNETISHLRKHNRLEVEDPEGIDRRRSAAVHDAPRAGGLDWISDEDLLRFIERLPQLQRQAIVLRYMLDLTTEEMCEVLDRTPVAVRKLEHRALRFLEDRLQAVRNQRAERASMEVRLRRAPVLGARRFALAPGAGGHERARAR